MRGQKTRRLALTGMLFALALVLSLFEGALAGGLGLPPGVKPGLANVVVMFCLLSVSQRQALLLAVLKGGFALLTRGAIAGVLSLGGGLLSIAVMVFLLWLPAKPSLLMVSVLGAMGHNVGQMLLVSLLFGQTVWVYTPVLLISAILMGCLTALLLKALLPPLQGILGVPSPLGGKGGGAQEGKGDKNSKDDKTSKTSAEQGEKN